MQLQEFDIFPDINLRTESQVKSKWKLKSMDFLTLTAFCVSLTIFLNIIAGFLTYYACKKFSLKVQSELEFKLKTEQLYLNKLKQNMEEYLKQSFRSQKKEHRLVKQILKK